MSQHAGFDVLVSRLLALELSVENIERKLDILVAALGEEDGPTHGLDGEPLPAERDQRSEL